MNCFASYTASGPKRSDDDEGDGTIRLTDTTGAGTGAAGAGEQDPLLRKDL